MIGSPARGRPDMIVALEQRAPEAAPARGHLRRCTFRRMSAVRRGAATVYTVDCLYPDRAVPIPLGDLTAARSICDACVASHVFRPDED